MTIARLYRAGSEALILFVHGLGCAKESFAAAFERPEIAGYALLAPDFPGCGDSPLPPGATPDMESYARVLRDLVADYAPARLHIVAHSMGAAPALLLARQADIGLASFVNIEGNLVAEDAGMLSRRTAETPLAEFVAEKYAKLLARAAGAEDAGMRAWADWLGRCAPETYHAMSASLVAWSDSGRLLEIFAGLAVPKLYVCGDRSADPDVLRYLDAIPKLTIPDCGHFVMSERPDAFYGALADFLAAAEAG